MTEREFRKYLAKLLAWMAKGGEDGFNNHTCEVFNEAARRLDPQVEIVFPNEPSKVLELDNVIPCQES